MQSPLGNLFIIQGILPVFFFLHMLVQYILYSESHPSIYLLLYQFNRFKSLRTLLYPFHMYIWHMEKQFHLTTSINQAFNIQFKAITSTNTIETSLILFHGITYLTNHMCSKSTVAFRVSLTPNPSKFNFLSGVSENIFLYLHDLLLVDSLT